MMTGRILNFAKSPHQSAQELLPWLVNGTLDDQERTQVEQHLQGCPACRAELDSMQALQSAYADSELVPEADAALARLRPQLQPVGPARRRSADRARLAPFGAASGWMKLAPFGAGPTWIKVALAVQFCLIFALGWQVLRPDQAGLEYHALAAAGGPARAAGNVVVVFDPTAPQRDVAQILRRSDARIVDGPTAANGFVLAVAAGDLRAALERLRAEPQVVLAEPLEAQRTR